MSTALDDTAAARSPAAAADRAPPVASAKAGLPGTVRDLLAARLLVPHFQVLVQLTDGAIRGHEALIRTPSGSPWPTPDALFAAARAEKLIIELEIECVRLALRRWVQAPGTGRLFVNMSANALITALGSHDIELIVSSLHGRHDGSQGVVVELTEHEQVRDFDALAHAARRLRRHGVQIALDDFGDGRSSLRLWSELKPEIVKIDKYFSRDLPRHPEKLQTLRALLLISQTLGSELVAEGIETADELHLVRDLGIRIGQGWLLGRPQAEPATVVADGALAVIRSRDLAVFPQRRHEGSQRATAWSLLEESLPLTQQTTNDEVVRRFNADAGLRALAVVDAQGQAVGLLGRQTFLDRYARPFFKELYGRKPCTLFANRAPRVVELDSGLDELTAILTSEDQRYLAEGFIITRAGKYVGLGSGEQLVRTVTEARIDAARHANPLTLLPGNIPIREHIQRLLTAGREFVACYADLNQFKPFNDVYGYWRGDEMILLAARSIQAHVDARRDFVGHVGGDDFVVLFQSEDWDERCLDIVADFNGYARKLYDEDALAAGGLMAEDRHGVQRFHALTTLSIGAVRVRPGAYRTAEDVASAAAAAKRRAKQAQQGVALVEAPLAPEA